MSQVIILSNEAEAYIESLKNVNIEDIGSHLWLQQHEYLEKLNMQAIHSANNDEDEFVKEFFISEDKIKFLIYDVLVTNVWKLKVFPILLNKISNNSITFPFYFILYHEVTVVSLLETLLFHKECSESTGDIALDLADYCYRKITALLKNENKYIEDTPELKSSEKLLANNSKEDLIKQASTLEFEIGIKSLSILRYLIDNLTSLPLSIGTRLLTNLDVPLLLVEVIEEKPWKQKFNGKNYIYRNSTWKIDDDDEQILQCEAQIWLSLFHLLLNEAKTKYEFNSFRKNIILKLRPLISNVLLDQIPVLIELQKFLDQLSIYEAQPVKSSLILDQIPEIWDNLINKDANYFNKIAEDFLQNNSGASNDNFKDFAKSLERIYNFDVLESMIPDPAKCACCGQVAVKRCSRCQNEWYCRRECQVKNWPKHKPICDTFHEADENKI